MKTKKIPERMCIGCRQMKPKGELIRIVRNDNKTVSLDPTGKASGRGAYICKDVSCLKKAEKLHAVEHALKCCGDKSLYDLLEKELTLGNG